MPNLFAFPDKSQGFVPQRLTEARMARQRSRAELARDLGISGQAVGYYEGGERRPDMGTLLRISELLEQPVSFFLRQSTVLSEHASARFFRSVGPKSNKLNAALDIKTKWLWEIVRFTLKHVRLPEPNLMIVDAPHGARYCLEEIEQIATKMRRHWGLGDGPIANVIALLETNGIIVSRFEMGSAQIDAFSTWVDRRPYVLLGSDKRSCARSRFDAAHELGHLLLHRDVAQEDLESKAVRDRVEKEAHWFAGAFLLPREALLAEFYSTRISHLIGMKRRWRVSMQAIAHRCKEIGAIDDVQYILFRKQLSARKELTNEPLDDELSLEQAGLLLKAWRLMIERKLVPEHGVEDQLGFSLDLVHRLCGMIPQPAPSASGSVHSLKR